MVFNSLGGGHTTHMHTYQLPGQKHAPGLIKQLTQHTIALSLEWINPLCHCTLSTIQCKTLRQRGAF